MTKILHKRGSGEPDAESLDVGEIALDTSAGTAYTKLSNGAVVEIGGGGGGGGIEEAPKTGKLYARKDEAWQEFEAGDIEPGNADGETLAWSTADAEWMPNDTLIVKGGKVGIGTDSPEELLHLYEGEALLESADANAGPVLKLRNDSGNQLVIRGAGSTKTYPGAETGMPQILCYSGYDLYVSADGKNDVIFTTNRAERMRIDSSGNAGIGVTPLGSAAGAFTQLQMGGASGHSTFFGQSNDQAMGMLSGGYYDASNNLKYSAGRSRKLSHFYAYNGEFEFSNAPAGAAGATATLTQRVKIDSDGRVGIGGQPSRSAEEIAKEAKDTLARWKSTFDERLKAEPKADKKAVTLEITGDEFDTLPTEKALIEKLTARNIGGGTAKLQVAGDGYFDGNLQAKRLTHPTTGTGILLGTNVILPVSDNTIDLGRVTNPPYRFKDAYFSGTVNATTINGRVTDVADHIKAITPTQIANWDAGTGGGGGGGATIDGRISDTQITHWDTAYGWGNHATAGYQPAGSYADTNHTHSQYLTSSSLNGYATESWVTSGYQPKGSYLTSSDLSGYATESWVTSGFQPAGNYATASHTHSEYLLKAGDWACAGNITATGNITAYASSDERLKDDIKEMPVGLIDSIQPSTWSWKEGGKASGGVVAQQLQECGLGDWVNEAPDGMLGVDYNALIGVLLAEVKSLKDRVKELEK